MKITLDKIIKSHYCIGCGLCASVAEDKSVEMILGADGFIIPMQSQSALGITPAFLRDICPGITVRQKQRHSGVGKIYGNFESFCAAYSNDELVRWKASSGGCITALLIYMLESSTIDGVLHIGKDEAYPIKSCAHFSRSREEVIRRSGSRYAPSSLLCDLLKLLRTGVKMAIVGKPCDIVGVCQFLRSYPQYEKQVVCKISFMCMGMPSLNATYKLIESIGVSPNDVQDFWYRGNGWPGKATVISKLNQRYEIPYQESWGDVLCKEVNFRCKICPDGYGEFADISCGDAWFVKDGRPSFDEKPGRSLVFIRTSVGRKILEQAQGCGYLVVEEMDVNELKIIQSSQYDRKIFVGARILALKLLGDRLLDFSGFSLYSNLRKARKKSVLKNFMGTIKRRLMV